MDCVNCGAPLPAKSIKCRHCGSLNDVDLRTVHKSVASAAASDRPCPHCETLMESVDLGIDGGFFIERCNRCLGIFFDPGELKHVLEISTKPVDEVDRQRLDTMIAEEYREVREKVRYVKCPVCSELMNRRIYGAKSGVIVDTCRHHGVWLDGGELAQLVKWMNAGGKIIDAQMKNRDAKAQQRKQKRDAAIEEAEHRSALYGTESRGDDSPLVDLVKAVLSFL